MLIYPAFCLMRTKWLLLECEENGIDELDVFEIVVDNIVELKSLQAPENRLDSEAWMCKGSSAYWCPCAVAADGVEETVIPDNRHYLLQHHCEEESAP